MADNLVIVESPAKAKTIEGFLGKDFIVKSSYGHVRDLAKTDKAVDIKNNFTPQYEVSPDKVDVIKDLRKTVDKVKTVWLASDEDREGEAISWHLYEVLGLNESNTKRIVFHEITKKAIDNAIATPRKIDKHLVDAQQARRILDRLVGFELSPVLWKKVKPSLSAGRVQSVAVRIIVEREREVDAFNSISSFKVVAQFAVKDARGNDVIMKADLNKKFNTAKEAEDFLNKCKGANFNISNLEVKPGKKTPSAPFTTSTLQQEASRKLGYSVTRTMVIAQKLYESGKITYMRTDSVNLSELALNAAKAEVEKSYGEKYSQTRQFKTKLASAQEAHEAIRPTYFENSTIDGENDERRLYELIWKRSIASQMADAILEKTVANISISTSSEEFIATGEVIKFDGFLKVYLEGKDDEDEEEKDDAGLLPPLTIGQQLAYDNITATERFTYPPARYTEASLVKKLEELGIGRPSTYAPTITTIQKRGYVIKEDRQGRERKFQYSQLKNDTVSSSVKSENTGAEKNKLFPTDIGTVVTDFLVKNFNDVLDYGFTALVEKEFDEIADGQMKWQKMISDFYNPFHKDVINTEQNSERVSGERDLGIDPVSGKKVITRIARFGPVVQLGGEGEEKPQFAKLRVGQRIESITLEEAMELFKLPRNLGQFENKDVTVSIGRFGPYIKHENLFASLEKTDDPYTIDFDRSVELIEKKRIANIEKTIKIFNENPEAKILKGRWGPYIAVGRVNLKIPKGTDTDSITYEDVMKLMDANPVKETSKNKRRTAPKKAAAKKAPEKKVAAKKVAVRKK